MLKTLFGQIYFRGLTKNVTRLRTEPAHLASEFSREDLSEIDTIKKLSKAMKNYLKKSEEFGKQMVSRDIEYEIGKRHLANMMGIDAEILSQKAIDEAIEYLFPSGLFSIKARPKMIPPEKLFPKQKDLQFDAEGKPFNTFFYTTKANYYSLIYNIVDKLEELDEHLIKLQTQALKTEKPPIFENVDLTGTKMMSKDILENKLLETLSKYQYDHFVTLMNRLCSHPVATLAKDFIVLNMDKMEKVSLVSDIPPVRKDEKGILYAEAYGKRKTCWAHATLTELSSLPTDGDPNKSDHRITINDKGIDYFPDFLHRGQVLLPLTFMGKLGHFGVGIQIAENARLGDSAKAGAARLAVARALTAFLTKTQIEEMRLAGLLTYDLRLRERKKPGLIGARARPRWRKR